MPPDTRLTNALSERYALESELGQGGMATVYLARDLKHDRQVAVKVLRPELSAILGRERFLAEVRLTAKLDHPHILTLLDSGESEGFVWYTLPYIRGESLRHKLERETQLSVDEAVSITRQIAGALEHAHQHGIIHRDVKPENILLHEGEAMLADFGIALAVKEAGGQRLTETGLSLGTPQYMSPEQATAERTLDARSDIYSLGAVLYEMLAGEPPFTGATGQAVIAKLMVQDAMSLRIVRKTIPAGLEAVVARALAKVPADRFPSAAAFAAALAAPETHRASRRVPKRALVLGGAAVVVLVLAGVWLAPRLRLRPAGAFVGEPTLTQVTFTGNAVEPTLSADGKKLAYGLQTCSPSGGCDQALVVEELGTGERKTVVDRFEGGMYRLTWSPDQRFLLVTGRRAGQRGLHLASLFSGEVRYLGEHFAGQFLGGSDTIVAVDTQAWLRDRNPGLATRWFPVLTADGAVTDSIPFQVSGKEPDPLPSPDGRRILIWSSSGNRPSDQGLYLIDRSGRLTDSLPTLPGFYGNTGLSWTAAGDGVMVLMRPDSTAPDVRTLLRFPVSAKGKVRLPPDTVARRLRLPMPRFNGGANSLPSQRGDIAVTLLDQTYSILTLERPTSSAPWARKAELTTATGDLGGWISPDGERVLVARSVSLEGKQARRLEVWPFDSGSGTPLGPPRLGAGAFVSWSPDSRTIYQLVRGAATGGWELLSMDAASGRSLAVRPVPDSLGSLTLQPGLMGWGFHHGWLWYSSSNRDPQAPPMEWRFVSPSGDSTLTLNFPDSVPWVNAAIAGPDGHGSWVGAVISSREYGDTMYTLHVARPGMPARPVMQFTGPWYDVTLVHAGPGMAFKVLANVLSAAGGGTRLIHLEPGRPPRDEGPMTTRPFFSADGRRAVRSETEKRTDIWLIRWTGGDSTGTK